MKRQPRRRRRPALSCLECQRRKIKCDRNDPCARCITVRTKCTYKVYSNDEPVIRQQAQHGTSWGSTASPSAHAPSPLVQAHQISTNGSITDSGIHPPGPRVTAATAAAGQNHIPNTQDAEPDLRDLLQRIQKLEESSSSSPTRDLSQNGRDLLARQSGLKDSQVILNKTRILRWTHWLGTAEEVPSALVCSP